MKYSECLDALEDWFSFHHSGCDETSCDMAEAENQGLIIWASYLLTNAIKIDPEYSCNHETKSKALKAYNLLNTKYKKRWVKDCEIERKELLKVSHMECEYCNAIIWQPEICNNYCSSCGNESKGESK